MISSQLPLTRIKLFIAKVIYAFLHLVLRKDQRIIQRNGITYEVDLSEAIDLSLFLFGHFQGYVFSQDFIQLSPSPVIVDVGANIGSMALGFAKTFPGSQVYAFEPTHYGFGKLKKNISLNPLLGPRIFPVQAFLSDKTVKNSEMKAYSSWKVDSSSREKHPLHGGELMSAESIPSVTLDDFCQERGLSKIDLMKIDTDGYELTVLRGALQAIAKFKPVIIFEIGLYLLKERGDTIEEYFDLFNKLNYRWFNSENKRPISKENYLAEIPYRSTIDVLAVPENLIETK